MVDFVKELYLLVKKWYQKACMRMPCHEGEKHIDEESEREKIREYATCYPFRYHIVIRCIIVGNVFAPVQLVGA